MEDMRNEIANYIETMWYDKDEFLQNPRDEEVEMFFGALNKLGRLTSFTLIPFDYSVDEKNIMKWCARKSYF